MPNLTIEEILAIDDKPRLAVDVPEWGGAALYIRAINMAEREAYTSEVLARADQPESEQVKGIAVGFLARVLETADGKRFTAEQLAGRKSTVIERLYMEARRYNGMVREKAEDAEKNSASGPSAASSSSSALPLGKRRANSKGASAPASSTN